MRTKAIPKGKQDEILAPLRPHWRLACDLSLETGWRISDVLNLPVGALRGRTVAVRAQKTGKTSKRQISRNLAIRLRQGAGQWWLFPSPHKGGLWPLTRSGAYRAIAKAAKGAGIANIGPHSLRKTYAKALYEAGMPIEEIQRLLQHDKLETTALYVLG